MKQYFQTLISVDQLSTIYKDDTTVILDCRYYLADIHKGRKEYLQSHIPGSYYVDIGIDLSAPVIKGVTGRHPLPHPDVLASTLRAAGLNTGNQVVVYDQLNGGYAARAWWLCKWLGFDNVAVLDGGFEAWKSNEMPVDNQWPAPKDGSFEYHLRNELIVGMDEIKGLPETLVDSREYKRYTGEMEPIDPIAGHIHGAICIPYVDNTNEKGIWKTPESLREKFSSIENSKKPPVFYCGSGVTACHNILAYKIATGRDSKLYPGSWSEWLNYYPAVTGENP